MQITVGTLFYWFCLFWIRWIIWNLLCGIWEVIVGLVQIVIRTLRCIKTCILYIYEQVRFCSGKRTS